MKFIIIGLGNFGGALARELMQLGHEVIGVDSSESKIEALKNEITIAVAMNATDKQALATLPLSECDAVIVAIGEDFESSVHITALAKKHKAKRIISRAFSDIQESIIQAIGVDQIIRPESEAADVFAKQLSFTGVLGSYAITEEQSLVEVRVPYRYLELPLSDLKLQERYDLKLLGVKRAIARENVPSSNLKNLTMTIDFNPKEILKQDDILVLLGENIDIERFLSVK